MKKTLIVSAVILSSCGGGSNSTSTPVTNAPTNTAPIIASANPDQTAQVGNDFLYDVTQNGGTFSDTNGDALTISVAYSQANGLNDANGIISGIPEQAISVTVTVTATDPSGAAVTDSFEINVGIDQDAIQNRFGGLIDLSGLQNYASQTVPNYIGPAIENGNPITDAGATLGRVLFYDTALSIDDTVSCASCHMQEEGFSDTAIVSNGVGSGVTRRHSMRLVNMMFQNGNATEQTKFWDERATSSEDQETQPIKDPNEHGFSGTNGAPGFDALITKMEAIDYYDELFRFAFLSPDITEERMQLSLAQFGKSIQSFDSRFDTGRAQVGNDGANFPNYTADENAGKTLFLQGPNQGGAGCDTCHRAPEFVIRPNQNGHNGIVGEANDPLLADFTNTRSPSLRDLIGPDGTTNGPFMHDGSLPTLRAVIDHYDNIPVPAGEPLRTDFLNTLSNNLVNNNGQTQNLNLSNGEKDQLEAFLLTLTGDNIYTDPKWSDPF